MCLREALCILLVEACIFVVLSDGARVTDLSGCSVYVRVVHGTRVRFYVKRWRSDEALCCGAVSQVSTRLITFFLNLLTARLLTVDAYGV